VAEQLGVATDPRALADEVQSEHGAAAPGRRQRGGDHPEQRALAGAVGTAQQHHLAALHDQADADDRRVGPEHAGHPAQGDRGRAIALGRLAAL
jgi:hypothetical protein